MSRSLRGSWLWVASAATIGLTIWTMVQTDDEPVPARSDRKAARRAEQIQSVAIGGTKVADPVENLRLDLPVREKLNLDKTNPFAAPVIPKPIPKRIVPPPEPVAPPPPPPSAPPMPFRYFGSYEDGSKRTVLLVRDGKIYTVAEGVNIDNSYRVMKIEDGSIEMVYLPLGISQTIEIGESTLSSKK